MNNNSGTKNSTFRKLTNAAIVGLALTAVSAVAIRQHRSPDAVPASAPATEFSAERALAHVKAIAQYPHAAGTRANAEVREYIKRQIEALGEKPEIQEAVVNRQPGMASTTQNILARVKGAKNTRPIALAAHYDSVLYGPGAADDGAGVAAMLEALRALKAGPPLQNDVMLIFTDAEEGHAKKSGIRGATAFAEQHPWAKEVGVLLNFDCRGTSGPAYMYETSPNNGWLIEQMIASGCRPLGNSSAYELSSRMPTGSDFTAFKNVGINGLNFAFLGGVHRYHTRLDDIDHLDPKSLQHFGSYALNITKHLGNLDLGNVAAPDSVYFNTFGSAMAKYPQAWAPRIAVGVALLFLLVMALGLATGRLSAAGTVFASFQFPLIVLVVVALHAVSVAIGYKVRGPYVLYTGDWRTLSFAALAFGASALFIGSGSGRTSMFDKSAGVLFLWTILALLTGFLLPGASFVFAWPALFAIITLALLMIRGEDAGSFGFARILMIALLAVPPLFILAPFITGLYPALTAVFGPALILLFMLLLGLLVPQLRVLTALNRVWIPALSFIAFVACMAMVATSFKFDSGHLKFASLSYGLNADTGKAYWLSCNEQPDEWTSQFFSGDSMLTDLPEFLGTAPDKYLKAEAPVADLAAPKAEVIEDSTQNNERRLKLRVTSQRKAPRIVIFADVMTDVISASAEGMPLKDIGGPWRLSYDVLPEKGIELTLVVRQGSPVTLTLVDHSYELPEVPGVKIGPMPEYMGVRPNTLDFNMSPLKSNETLVAKTFSL